MAEIHIKTIEQAQALPEIANSLIDEKGDIRPICGPGVEEDDIILFNDKDGRCMQIIYTPDGPTKCEFWI